MVGLTNLWASALHEDMQGHEGGRSAKMAGSAPSAKGGKKMENKMLIPCGEKCTLAELPCGTLFAFGDDCVAVKSEYQCNNGLIEAFIIGTGEQFWGGAKTAKEQNELMVQPLEIEDNCADDDLISRDYVMNAILSLHGVGGMYVYDPEEVHRIIADAPSVYGERRSNG